VLALPANNWTNIAVEVAGPASAAATTVTWQAHQLVCLLLLVNHDGRPSRKFWGGTERHRQVLKYTVPILSFHFELQGLTENKHHLLIGKHAPLDDF
jgi:hypothetical protein